MGKLYSFFFLPDVADDSDDQCVSIVRHSVLVVPVILLLSTY